MRKRLTRLAAALAALAALAVGGSALASAAQSSQPGSPPVTTAQPADPATAESQTEVQSGAADTDNVQQGDQTGSDPATGQTEHAASESSPSDGPGGYADTVTNADTQQTGEH